MSTTTLCAYTSSPRPPIAMKVVAIALTAGLAAAACAGGARPVLVDTGTNFDDVAAGLPAAPPDVALVGPAAPDSAAMPTIEDAIDEWARSAGISYIGDCIGRQTAPGELCGRAEGISDVYLIGPDTLTTWYVVSLGFNAEGYRVDRVALAGS